VLKYLAARGMARTQLFTWSSPGLSSAPYGAAAYLAM
jgi:hypothetical protein